MSFLSPGWIALAAVASLVVAGIHLISWRLPRTVILPTARFVPDEPARRAARTLRPADLALLALRVAIIMVGGLALARPVITSPPSGRATVVAVEWSAAATDSTALLNAVRSFAPGDKVSFVVFDTGARVLDDADALSRAIARPATVGASLSVGLLAATREARRLARDYERVSIALVSPFSESSLDQATEGIRSTWPDSLQVRRVAAASRVPQPALIELPGNGDDPVVAGIRLAKSNDFVRGTARVIRGDVATSDNAWADSGRVLVIWRAATPGAAERVDAVRAGDQTAIGHFIPMRIADSGRVVARWANGRPAAREVPKGSGCVRTIGFDVPDVGDFVLTPSFQRLAAELVGPCQGLGASLGQLLSDSVLASLAAPPASAPRIAAADAGRVPNRLAAIMVMAGIILLLVELLVRRRVGRPAFPVENAA